MPILVMEEAKGAIIGEVIKKQIAATDVREILLRIAKAMSEVHKCGYIHRDLATDNIFVDDVGGRNDVTVIDFGVAAVKDDCETFARTKSITHKGFFSPPEQYKNGGGIVSIGNDIFSLGATGYAMLVSSEQVKKDLANNISPPYNPGNHFFDKTIEDQHLFDVITKATNETRSNRFAIMDDMVAMLEGAPPSELFPRIIVDGQAYPLMLDKVKWFLGRNHPPFSEADILVNETSPGATHISRKQAYIERMGNEECIFKLHHQGVNDTRVAIVNNGHSVRWNKVGSQGFPLGAKHTMICFGYAETPPGKKDANGNPLQPGPYKVLEYFPPEPDT